MYGGLKTTHRLWVTTPKLLVYERSQNELMLAQAEGLEPSRQLLDLQV